jgi:hypothetical protein
MSSIYDINNLGIPEPIQQTYLKYQSTVVTAVMTSIIFLITLAWNDVIQTAINSYYPKKDNDTLRGKIYYAITITVFVILMQIYVFPYLEQYKT